MPICRFSGPPEGRISRAAWIFVLIFAGSTPVESSRAADSSGPAKIVISANSSAMRRYTPGKWSAVTVRATNHTQEDGTANLAIYFGKEFEQQFARRMWVPAKSERATWLPMRAPLEIDTKRSSFDMTMMPLVGTSGREILGRREGMELLPSLPLLADLDPIKTVGIYRHASSDKQGRLLEVDVDAHDLMAETRQFSEYSRVILELANDFVPPHSVMWESVDQCVLCGDRITNDSMGLTVLRNWLFRGGRLCIFLDRTSPETVAAILGHANRFQVIDRVELDDFTIENRVPLQGQPSRDQRRFETPVELVRVVADGVEVQCEINGWPAAFWQQVGDGEVLLMALAPKGWGPAPIEPGWESLPENKDPAFREHYAIKSLGMRFYRPRSADPNLSEVLKTNLQQEIGYRIPSRALATGLLGLHGVALAIAGLWLASRNQLDRLAWVLPIVAGTVTAVFLVVGMRNNRSVPASVAFTQLVRHVPETNSANVSGVAAIYQQTSQNLDVEGGSAGLLVPLMKPGQGNTHRLLWTDSDSGSWVNVLMPAGSVQFAKFEQSVVLPQNTSARAHFGPRGLVGRFSSVRDLDFKDALIASLPAPPSGVHKQPDGTFLVTPSDVFSSGQFLASTVVSDESRRRQEVYRSLLTKRDESNFAVAPTLFVWSPPETGALLVPEGVVKRGSALAAVPLWIDRTPQATEFAIPATFIRVSSVSGVTGPSSTYNARNGKWVTNASRATNTRLRFQLPHSVLPCKVTAANLTMKLNAPSRELHLNAVVGKGDVLMQRTVNPSGVYQLTVDNPEWLTLDKTGGLEFTVVITESEQERLDNELNDPSKLQPQPQPQQDVEKGELKKLDVPTSFTTWGIDYVRLDVRGTTL